MYRALHIILCCWETVETLESELANANETLYSAPAKEQVTVAVGTFFLFFSSLTAASQPIEPISNRCYSY